MRKILCFAMTAILVLGLSAWAFGAAVDTYPTHNGTPGQNDMLYYLNMTDAAGSRSRSITVGYLMRYLNFQESWSNIEARSTSGKASQYPFTTNGSMGNLTQPDYPRNVVFTITDADSSLGNVTICVNGTGSWGNSSTTEYFNQTTPGEYNGSIPFAHIASVEVQADGAAAADTLDLGYGNYFGTANRIESVYKYNVNATDNATSNLAINATMYSIYFGDVPDGTGNRTIWYKTSGQ